MKKSLREMHEYVCNNAISPIEAYYVTRMEGAGETNLNRRNNEIDYVYLAMRFIEKMSLHNRLNELSDTFLDRCYNYTTDYCEDLIDICYFPENVHNDIFRYITKFYEFFVNDEYDYGEHKFEIIKNYFINDDKRDTQYFPYQILMAIDLNICAKNAMELSELLEQVDYDDFIRHFTENNIKIYELNKMDFIRQLKYVKTKYVDGKYLPKKKVLKKD